MLRTGLIIWALSVLVVSITAMVTLMVAGP